MGRRPCCAKVGLNRGAWTTVEDKKLVSFIRAHGEGEWRSVPKRAGLKRCGKSCRLRWLNYLRPDIKRGNISAEEEDLIIRLHNLLGNRWSLIAGRLPGRTDNEIKNYWNTILAKKVKADSSSGSPKENSPPPTTTGPLVTSATATTGPRVIRTKATRLTRVPVIPSVPLHVDDYTSNFDATNSHIRDASNIVIPAAVGDDVDAKGDYDLPFGDGLLNDWTANDDSNHLENYGASFDFDSLAFLLDSDEWLGQENS